MKHIFKFIKKSVIAGLTALILCSCSATKFVPDGEYLLNNVKIESDVPEYRSMELRPYLRQQPNYKMFGLNKTTFQIYNLAGKNNRNWFNRFLKKLGEPPVIFDSTLVYKTNSEFQKLLVNKGYVDVDVTSEIMRHNKKADVIYRIKGNEPYRIRVYATSIEDSLIRNELYGGMNGEPLRRIAGESSTLRTSYVKAGMLFDRNLLDAERERLTTILQNRGYFTFEKENIIYDADSSLNAHAVDLELKLRTLQEPVTNDSTTYYSPYKEFYYGNVFIYLDYDPLRISNINNYPKQDSIVSNGYTIYYYGKKPSLRTRTLLNNCFITPGRQYSQLREELTYSSFSTLHALNNIHIQFDEKQRNDSALLDCHILTMAAQKQAVSFAVDGTNTSGDLGVATSVNYTHRNLFRGAETFNFRIRGAYEAMTDFSNPYLELGGEASIHIPKIVFPFINNSFLRRMRTSTEFTLSYNYQTRPEYDRTLLSGGIRYSWQGRTKMAARHQFDLLDIDYVYLPRIDEVFLQNLPRSARYFGYANQFIFGTSYSFYHSSFDPMQKQKRSAHSFRFSLESAGNALYGLSSLFDWDKDERGSYRLLNTPFAQFVKGDVDYTKTIVMDRQNSIAWRIGGGIGIPYGNSEMLPFEKRYYSGGANSVRAWSVRELGPGNYVSNAATTFFNQSGDIKLDMNIEYRSRFFWKLEAAAFIDAGNIWTIKSYEGQEGGEFKLNTFYKQIALGYGIGLRLDFDYFLLRLDGGMKAYNPAQTGKDKWTIFHPNFGENFAWHFAVGYPF
ncbi:MAG: outer membrane protein assembly factor [Candidatus Symbiothrix sp.]|nr:outer membrane protein assembly factor [Candidatus Symbiothrix sp.]